MLYVDPPQKLRSMVYISMQKQLSLVDAKLSCNWLWKICEYQKRGTVHICRCFCLDCDPDIIKSAEIVLKDCIVEFSMDKYCGWKFTTGERFFPQKWYVF